MQLSDQNAMASVFWCESQVNLFAIEQKPPVRWYQQCEKNSEKLSEELRQAAAIPKTSH